MNITGPGRTAERVYARSQVTKEEGGIPTARIPLANSHNDLQEETKLIRELQEQGVEGIVLFPPQTPAGRGVLPGVGGNGFPAGAF